MSGTLDLHVKAREDIKVLKLGQGQLPLAARPDCQSTPRHDHQRKYVQRLKLA
jgi:hypothetical protein